MCSIKMPLNHDFHYKQDYTKIYIYKHEKPYKKGKVLKGK